jgi:actin-related protein 9
LNRRCLKMAFRDGSVVIIETGRTSIRAGIGLQELLKAPSVVLFPLIFST